VRPFKLPYVRKKINKYERETTVKQKNCKCNNNRDLYSDKKRATTFVSNERGRERKLERERQLYNAVVRVVGGVCGG
jgi:hypothetical protein